MVPRVARQTRTGAEAAALAAPRRTLIRGTRWDGTRRLPTQEPCQESSEVALCVRSGRLQALNQVHTVEVWGSRPQSPTKRPAQRRCHGLRMGIVGTRGTI